MMKRLLFLTSLLLCNILTLWAEDVTVNPTLEVNFRTASGNTAWQSGFPKNAADDGVTTMEGNYFAGMFVLQKYTVANIKNATKLVVTLTDVSTSGVDGMMVWSYPNSTWTASSGIDDLLTNVTTAVGIAPRATEGDTNSPLATGAKVSGSSPAKATFTISGTALATVKASASEDGTFTLMFTDKSLKSNSSRKFQSSNTATAETNRPTLVATIETPTVVNKTTGVTYSSLNAAFAALTDADTELEVYEDQTLTGRCTWNKAHTLTITPKADITIKGHTNQMWFLANENNANLVVGSSDYAITLDGQNNKMGAYPITKREKTANITLKNVTFQNFDLNNQSALCQGGNADGVITLDGITVKNSKNPAKGFFYNERVTNDKLVLKGYLNIDSDCSGTNICATAEYKSDTQVNGRIKVDDNSFTASNVITIDWLSTNANNVFIAGISVVVGVKASFADRFSLTNDSWALGLSGSDLKIVAPTAKIGTKGYADVAMAMSAVQDGETITLLADQEVSSRINVQNKAVTIDGANYTIKRATDYTNGLLFLTVKPGTGEKNASLTLKDMTIDGQSISTSAAVIEASNNGTTTLNNVTIQNVVTTADAAVVNKLGGKLILQGAIGIPSIYVAKGLTITATGATMGSTTTLVTEAGYAYGLLVEGGDASKFSCSTFRLSQQQDGIYVMPLPVANSYTHPGLLHTSADINAVKARITAGDALTAAAYSRLENQSGGSAAGAVEYLKRMDSHWSDTYADYGNFSRAATDAKLAYELALRYQLKGSTAAATAAVNILNNWATVNKGMLRLTGYNNNIPDPNEYLMTIQAYQFANAAELLRGYSGWAAADFTKFQNWIRQTFADVAILFLGNHHKNADPQHYWLNWDLAALTAMYSVGVLCDDQALVDYALDYVNNGAGNGNKSKAVVATHSDPDSDETLAQCQESGRDQGHATLDITLLGAFCQMAQSQGTDLFTPYKAMEMAEYVGKYNLKDASDNFMYGAAKVPYTSYTVADHSTMATLSEAERGTVRPSWELFHAYAVNAGKSDIYTKQWVDYMRQQNSWGEAEGTSTDELGFGTLMYGKTETSIEITVSDAGAATLVLPFGAALPSGVRAYTVNYTAGKDQVKTTEVNVITANQPVLINAVAGTYTFTSNGTTNSNAPQYGALTGVYASTKVPENSYILKKSGAEVGFAKVTSGTVIVTANHAYLTADGAGSRSFLGIGGTTGIEDIITDMENQEYYDLQGRRVLYPKKGFYIVNGKKVIIK